MPVRRGASRTPLRQVHIWLSPDDSRFLADLARSRDESVSRLLRRAIAAWRAREDAAAVTPRAGTGIGD